jgi:hypothetical protein
MEAQAEKKLSKSPLALAEGLWVLGNYYFNRVFWVCCA